MFAIFCCNVNGMPIATDGHTYPYSLVNMKRIKVSVKNTIVKYFCFSITSVFAVVREKFADIILDMQHH